MSRQLRVEPVVRRALDYVAALQLPFGGIAWSQEHTPDGSPSKVNAEGLLAGSSSIYHSFKAGVALSELMDQPQPEWEIVAGRLGHAVREHRARFLDKSNFSMDWYYPVLGGPVRGDAGFELLASRWHEFVEPGFGIRCVLENRWLIGAVVLSLATHVAVVYVPVLQEAFHTVPLTLGDWVVATGVAASLLVVMEITKLVLRRQQPAAVAAT